MDGLTTDQSATSAHYDLRGAAQLSDNPRLLGSEALPQPFRRPYVYAENQLASFLTQGAKTLADVCCGIGCHGVKAGSFGYIVRGIDLSPRSVEAAQKLVAAQRLETRCTFETGDALAWLAASPRFDVIFISGSLYYLRTLLDARLIREHLVPGGRFLCIETNGSNVVASAIRRVRSLLRRDRDQQTLTGLLTVRELDEFGTHFKAANARYFDFFTPIVRRLSRVLPKPIRIALDGAAAWLDDRLLNLPGFRRLAFKVVFIGTN